MSSKRNITYKCPYCDKRFNKENLVIHIGDVHDDMIPEGYSAFRVVFDYVNKRPAGYNGKCIICGNESGWDENKGKYNRICSNPNCKKKYIESFEKRMINAKGVKRISSTAEGQAKMLANRKISGKYKFKDGVEKTYTGTYEKKALEFMDKVMNIRSEDVTTPGPIMEYMFEGKKHIYISDIYYAPYNLIIEVKDGGNNPNMREMKSYRAKQIEKEKYIIKETDFNYLRLTNNDFSQLLAAFMELKMQMSNDTPERVIRINEGIIQERSLSGPVILYHGSIDGSYNKILNNSPNIGKKYEPMRTSSFWFIKKEYAEMFATGELLHKFSDKKIDILIDNDMRTLVDEQYKSLALDIIKNNDCYVYSKLMDGKNVTGGNGRNFPEYTIDFTITPDKVEKVSYKEKLNSIKFASKDYINKIIEKYKKNTMTFGNSLLGQIKDYIIYPDNQEIRKKRKEMKKYIEESYIEESAKITYSNDFNSVKNIVDSLSSNELSNICNNGNFTDSPYTIYREVLNENNKPVAFIDAYSIPEEMDKNEAAIVVACNSKYRGKGYIDNLVSRAIPKIKELNIRYLYWETDKSNKASSSIAKKFGFKPAKNFSKDDDNYVLDLNTYIEEGVIQEISRQNINSKYLEKGDSCYNLDKWPDQYNILFVTGISGSGKTTLGIDLAKEFNCGRVELDYIAIYYLRKCKERNLQNKYRNLLAKECPEAVEFFDLNPDEKYGLREKWSGTEDILKDFCNWFINKYQNNGKSYIINGAYLYDIYDTGFFYDKPLIIKDINYIKTVFRRTWREFIDDYYDTFFHKLKSAYKALKTGLSKSYRDANKNIKSYKKDMDNNAELIESYIEESFSNFEFLDIKSNKTKALNYLKANSQTSKYAKDTIDNYNGELVIYENNMIGRILIGDKKDKGFITDFEIDEKFRGNKLGSKLIDDAINKYHGIDLVVDKSNKLAIDMYKKRGFVIIKTNKDMGDQYYMKLKFKLDKDDEIINEGFIKSEPDILYNKKAFDNGDINICFIMGHSGSGKSTMAHDLESNNIEVYELDDMLWNHRFTDSELKEYGDLIYSFFKGPGKKFRVYTKDEWRNLMIDKVQNNADNVIKNHNLKDCTSLFIDYAIKWAKNHKDKKFVLEGVWLYYYFEPSYFKDYAFYIKGTSLLKSKIRAAKRNNSKEEGFKKLYKTVSELLFDNWKYYWLDEKDMNKFRDYFKNKPETVLSESYIAEASTGLFKKIQKDPEIVETYGFVSSNNIYNENIKIKGFNKWLRGRSELLIIDKDKVYLKKDNKGYSIPGGGWEKDEDHNLSAIRETNEEARIKVKNVSYVGSYASFFEPKDWVKERISEENWWYGEYTELYIGEYDGEFKGHVDKIDQDKKMESGKFYDIKSVYKDLISVHQEALDNIIDESYIEESKDASDLKDGFKKKSGKSFKLIDIYSSSALKYINKKWRNDKFGRIAVCNQDDKLAGYIYWNKSGNIAPLEVYKDYRGFGLSELLLKEAIRNGGNKLGVYSDNQIAINLYKKFGFVEVGRKKYKDGDEVIIMELKKNKVSEAMNALMTGFIPGSVDNPNNTYIVNYMQNNVFSEEDPNEDCIGVSDSPLFKNLIIRDKDNVLKKVDESFLKDKEYKVYIVEKSVEEVSKLLAPYMNKEVEFGFLYETLTGKKLYTKDQIGLEGVLIPTLDYYEYMKQFKEVCDNFFSCKDKSEVEINESTFIPKEVRHFSKSGLMLSDKVYNLNEYINSKPEKILECLDIQIKEV